MLNLLSCGAGRPLALSSEEREKREVCVHDYAYILFKYRQNWCKDFNESFVSSPLCEANVIDFFFAMDPGE